MSDTVVDAKEVEKMIERNFDLYRVVGYNKNLEPIQLDSFIKAHFYFLMNCVDDNMKELVFKVFNMYGDEYCKKCNSGADEKEILNWLKDQQRRASSVCFSFLHDL